MQDIPEKIMEYTYPKLVSNNNDKMFLQFHNGSISKAFKNATIQLSYEDVAVVYKIVNLDDSVEYIDMLGNIGDFAEHPSQSVITFINYYNQTLKDIQLFSEKEDFIVDKKSIKSIEFFKGIPLNCFLDKRFLDALYSVEYMRYLAFDKHDQFKNLLTKNYYYKHIFDLIDEKIQQAQEAQTLSTPEQETTDTIKPVEQPNTTIKPDIN